MTYESAAEPDAQQEPIEIVIEGLGYRGEGYIQIQPGRFISVPHTLPGDRVIVRPGPWRRGRAWAEVVTWVERNPKHVPPECPHYDQCSGCALRHMSPDAERLWKRDALRQILQRYGPDDLSPTLPIDWVDAGARHNHRVRGRFRFAYDGDQLTVGLRNLANSPGIVDVRDCPAQSERFRTIMVALASIVEANVPHGVPEQAELWTDIEHNNARLVMYANPETQQALQPALVAFAQDLDVAVVWVGADDEEPEMEPFITSVAPGIGVEVPWKTWCHATPHAAACMTDWVATRFKEGDHRFALDLCCGIGTVAFKLANIPGVERLIAVDEDHRACQVLQSAATQHGAAHIEVRAGRVGRVLRKLRRELTGQPLPTGVVINPMRKPLGLAQLRDLANLGIRQVIYLGPSPVSAARDARVLGEMGFKAIHAAGVNLHPATGQVMLALDLRLKQGE